MGQRVGVHMLSAYNRHVTCQQVCREYSVGGLGCLCGWVVVVLVVGVAED